MSTCSTDNVPEKEDIYQFGVILLEVITGKSISSVNEVEELKDEVHVIVKDSKIYINKLEVDISNIQIFIKHLGFSKRDIVCLTVRFWIQVSMNTDF